MYKELFHYFRHMRERKELWKDGEFVTAVISAAIAVPVFIKRPDLMDGIRSQLGSLLSATSIIFGFALSTLTFYIAAVSRFASTDKIEQDSETDPADKQRRIEAIKRVANKLVDWHVWTVLCLLLLVVWILVVWIIDSGNVGRRFCYRIATYSALVFLTFYSGGQVVNHCLTLWWYHYRRDELESGADDATDRPGDRRE
jgi:hypothetical protein